MAAHAMFQTLICRIRIHRWAGWVGQYTQNRTCGSCQRTETRLAHDWREWKAKRSQKVHLLTFGFGSGECERTRTCDRCHLEEVLRAPHNWAAWQRDIKHGSQERECNLCGDKEVESLTRPVGGEARSKSDVIRILGQPDSKLSRPAFFAEYMIITHGSSSITSCDEFWIWGPLKKPDYVVGFLRGRVNYNNEHFRTF